MPLEPLLKTKYKPDKKGTASWDSFNQGLNTFLRDTEIQGNELAKADNILLVGSGVPTKRWGSANYFLAGATGYVRGLSGYYTKDGVTHEALALTDWGYLTKNSGASYTLITGASFSSGYAANMVQLNDNMYIVNGTQALTKYDGTNLVTFTALSTPTGLAATNLSGVSGTFTYSYRVSAESETGETLASDRLTLANLPQDPSDTLVKLTWTTSSPASSVKGYVIYGREEGNETLIDRVDSATLTYLDDGSAVPSPTVDPVTADTTGGPIAKYIITYDNRLIIAGLTSNPSRVMFSGKGSNSEKFHWSQGGGYVDIDVDDGDMITGLGVFEDKVVVFKENAVYSMSFEQVTYGNWTLTLGSVTPITKSHGCISHKTIKPVENDLFYLARDGIYVLGYEPNLFNVIRANEISVRVRDYFKNLIYTDLQTASAEYFDKKYTLAFVTKKEFLTYDRERVAWTGPHDTPYGINILYRYEEADGDEKWLAGTDDTYAVSFSDTYKNDRGTAFSTLLRTRKENFGTTYTTKSLVDTILEFRDLSGVASITIYYEDESGRKNIARTLNAGVSANNSGWGSDQWADFQWADSGEAAVAATLDDLIRRIILEAKGRNIQVEISTSSSADDYELLSITLNASGRGRGSIPYDYNL